MSDSPKQFFGIPVVGDIVKTTKQDTPQRPIEEFGPYLQAVLDIPQVESIRWRQYTPYFNDGEPCEFSIYGLEFKIDGVPADAGDYEDGYVESWSLTHISNTHTPLEHGLDETQLRTLNDLEIAVEGGAFYDVLLDTFGDHAKIEVNRERIEIEFYDHD